jgi:hypothetical protein
VFEFTIWLIALDVTALYDALPAQWAVIVWAPAANALVRYEAVVPVIVPLPSNVLLS